MCTPHDSTIIFLAIMIPVSILCIMGLNAALKADDEDDKG